LYFITHITPCHSPTDLVSSCKPHHCCATYCQNFCRVLLGSCFLLVYINRQHTLLNQIVSCRFSGEEACRAEWPWKCQWQWSSKRVVRVVSKRGGAVSHRSTLTTCCATRHVGFPSPGRVSEDTRWKRASRLHRSAEASECAQRMAVLLETFMHGCAYSSLYGSRPLIVDESRGRSVICVEPLSQPYILLSRDWTLRG
jgi:hypothetical protein